MPSAVIRTFFYDASRQELRIVFQTGRQYLYKEVPEAIFDREPLERWSSGRITLLGDAAHPMLPFLAQGGAMAMEDGFVLAECLRRRIEDVPSALREYESLRKDRATRVQLGSRARSDMCQVVSPLTTLRRDLGFLFNQWFNPGAAIQKADWIYSYDVARLAAG